MKDITKQMREYELLLEVAAIPFAERHQLMMGAELYFDRGWPINHFTVGMAARAGNGLVPPVYDGLGSEERYFLGNEECYLPTPDSPAHAPDVDLSPTRPCRVAPNYRRGEKRQKTFAVTCSECLHTFPVSDVATWVNEAQCDFCS